MFKKILMAITLATGVYANAALAEGSSREDEYQAPRSEGSRDEEYQAPRVNVSLFDLKSIAAHVMDEVRTSRLPWTVGEKADYKLDVAGMIQGTLNVLIREETAEGIWVDQLIDVQIQKQKVETLFDKETGQVKRMLIDGKEQKIEPTETPDIVESKPDTVKVPKFPDGVECGYIKLRNKKDNTETEVWINPEIVPIAGMIKTIAQSQMGPVTVELTDFLKK
jgi:hypothetical protein